MKKGFSKIIPGRSGLPKINHLILFSLRALFTSRARLVAYTLPLAIPLSIIVGGSSPTDAVAAYGLVLLLFLQLIVMYCGLHIARGNGLPPYAQAYYLGSAGLLRFIVMIILLSPLLVFLGIGVYVLAFALSNAGGGFAWWEQLAISLLGASIAAVPILAMGRLVVAPYIVAYTRDVGPMNAITHSFMATKGKGISIASRVLGLGLLYSLLAGATIYGANILAILTVSAWPLVGGQLITNAILLPFFFVATAKLVAYLYEQ